MNGTVHERLHAFATGLLERRGALVDWPAADREGTAMLPPEVAAVVGTPEEIVPLACEPGGPGLCVNLATDFLEWAGRLLDSEPRVGTFRVRNLYLKRKELEEGVRRTFTWLNAKVKMREARPVNVEYHTWWFHASITSEDRWETQFAVSLNAASGVDVEIPDPLRLWELEPRPAKGAGGRSTEKRAAEVAKRALLRVAAGFLDRMDSRLQRDRKRLREYYHALLKEADKKKTRGNAKPDPEKTQARKRAVHLELRRKLAELDERYAMEARLAPVVLIRTEVPVLAVDLSVFRKRSQQGHTVYWNPLLKRFEPMACSRCGDGAFALAFTNDQVQPLCPRCSARPEH